MALAANGNLYMTGSGEPIGRFGTVAYDPDGTLLWDAHYNPPDTYAGNLYGASAIALDSAGDVYITGSAADGRYYVTVKYDANGRQLWADFKDMGSEAKVAPSAIAVDRSGNVIVTGYDRTQLLLSIIKYSQNNAAPALSITKTHSGNFSLGQQGATYGVTVSNLGKDATSGVVTVTETIPPGLTLVSMAGTGWTCAGNACTRSDALSGGASYPEIKVTVNVFLNAPDSVDNVVTVSGGGSASATNIDRATIVPGAIPVLSITKTHTGNFSQGQQGATYGVTVSNQAGKDATSGVVTVTETIPTGLALASMQGTGWTCAGNAGTRSDALSGGARYPEIKVTVNVAADAPSPVTNMVSVVGGGSGSASASDVTTINPLISGSGFPESPHPHPNNYDNTQAYTLSCSATSINVTFDSQTLVEQGFDFIYVMDGSGVNIGGSPFTGRDLAGATKIVPGNTVKIRLTSDASVNSYGYKVTNVTGNGGNCEAGPALSITKTHTGSFSQGQQGATYGVTVSNLGKDATSGVVTVTETIPPGLTLVSMAGSSWTCSGNTCTRSDALSGGARYPDITVTVNVAFNAPAQVINVVGVSGGGFAGASASDPTNISARSSGLSITKSHSGNFAPGQQGATYSVTVSNGLGAEATSGTLTVVDTLPPGLTLVSMTGAGWACAGSTCTRSDALSGGASYPPIKVTVNVAFNAPAQVTNVATVSGGGSAGASASDVTTIVSVAIPVLSITKTHTGNFSQGQQGATYAVTVSNFGQGATSGTVTVTETIPPGLTLVSMEGSGWTCAGNTCTRSDALNGGASYPPIRATVNVAANAPAQLTNVAAVSDGGSAGASASDVTQIGLNPPVPTTVRWTAVNPPPRNSTSMALDAGRNQIVLFGGSGRSGDLADTWIWDGDRWTMRSPANSPPARERHAMAYDAARGQVVLFSGYGVTNDTWVWDGSNWTRKNPSTSPPALSDSAMAYDAAREQVVLFGGNPANNDTWVWDGSTWTKKTPDHKPPARWYHAMVYDQARGQVVLFGGLSSSKLNDTWVWDGTDWTQKTPATSPPARSSFGMAYDASRAQVVVFGGSDASNASLSDTWSWDGSNWTPQSPANKPPGRSTHAMAYDSARAQVLIFGGTSYRGDTWAWDGTNWSRTSVAPPPRIEFSMAYDSARRQVVLYGGYGGNSLGYFADTWVWDGAHWIEKPVAGPGPRRGHSMAYDAARAQVVLFGGTDQNSNWYNDVWAWDGTAWSQKAAAGDSPGIPSRRTNSAMAYDAARQRIVLFGGEKGPSFGDTWLWDGSRWASAPGGPPARHYHAMAYDAARSQVVLFGGANPSLMNDTWTWDGSKWTQKNPSASPAARSQHALAYNTSSGHVVLFGGLANIPAGDTWEWDGSSWTQTTTHTDHRGDPSSWPDDPGTRYSHRMAYDEVNGQVVLFGGTGGGNYLDDTWVYPFQRVSALSPASEMNPRR